MSFNPKIRQAGRKGAPSARDARAAELAPVIAELRVAGITTRKGIAAALNQRGFPTPQGRGRWYPMQVSRVLRRLAG